MYDNTGFKYSPRTIDIALSTSASLELHSSVLLYGVFIPICELISYSPLSNLFCKWGLNSAYLKRSFYMITIWFHILSSPVKKSLKWPVWEVSREIVKGFLIAKGKMLSRWDLNSFRLKICSILLYCTNLPKHNKLSFLVFNCRLVHNWLIYTCYS